MNKNHLVFSLLITISMSFLIPSSFSTEGIGTYTFGVPFSYITIYQHEQGSIWLGANLFSGNAGLSINPLLLFINVIVIYFLIRFIIHFKSKREARTEQKTN